MTKVFKYQTYLVPIFMAFAFILASNLALANEYCEVIAVQGNVVVEDNNISSQTLEQGMLLSKGAKIKVMNDSYADLAFDEEWQNTSRLSQNTEVYLSSISPVRIIMNKGDLYSKLDNLPANTSFEIKTPTVIAAARGTQYRVTHQNGSATVFNDSVTSLVYVYRLDANGNRAGRAIVLRPGESVTIDGEAEVYTSLLDELEEARDREDQDSLNDDLNRTSLDQPNSDPPKDQIRVET